MCFTVEHYTWLYVYNTCAVQLFVYMRPDKTFEVTALQILWDIL
jgi:hypothetical protein